MHKRLVQGAPVPLEAQSDLRYHDPMAHEYDHQELDRIASLLETGLGHELSRREFIRRGLALGLSLPTIGAALAACGIDPPATGSGQAAGNISPWRPSEGPAATPAPLRGSLSPAASVPPAPIAPTPVPPVEAAPTQAAPTEATRFAVVGDYGMEGEPAAAVAALVAAWVPEFVITTGDNNYPDGASDTIDRNIGQYYQAFIAPYHGAFGPGAVENRFFPVLGNHDWVVGYPEPYLGYFSLPGNGRYYSMSRGPLRFFALDSMPGEPDGVNVDSAQAQWLQAELAASTARWNVVCLHHPPFSSGLHGPSDWMQWPFATWGAQLVLAGHDHSYERITREGICYIVNGLGGAARYAPGFAPADGSQLFFNAEHGAMLVEADAQHLRLQFVTRAGNTIDDFIMT